MARIDRSVSLVVSRMRRDGAGIPILMYHSVSDEGDNHRGAYFATNTTPRVFAGHLEALAELGYRSVDLEAVATERLPERGIVITFDDGYADFVENAMPLLSRYGYQATVFVPVGLVSSPGSFAGRRLLTWDQIRRLRSAGVAFGSHTLTHRPLGELTHSELGREIALSKTILEQELGQEAPWFSHPFAYPEADAALRRSIRERLIEAGYRRAVTTRIGTHGQGDDLLAMKRLPVNDRDDVRLLRAKLVGAYDWMHAAQKVYKSARSALSRVAGGRPSRQAG